MASGIYRNLNSQAPAAVTVSKAVRKFGERVVLKDIDLEIAPGEFVVLLGPSGCGKSTLLRLLAKLDQPDAGRVSVPEKSGVVFQDARLMPWRRVWQNVVLGLPRNKHVAQAALAEVGLQERANDWPGTLSGGEAQRAALARALVRQPELLLLDEPFAALDALTRLRMQQLVIDLWQAHQPAVLLVTHDVDEALLMADRILVMREGKIAIHEEITLARPRQRNDDRFEVLRQRFLGELGVHTTAPATPDATGSSRDALIQPALTA